MPREHREPGPDHPITVTPFDGRVTVSVGGTVVADTTRALTLQESTYPPVRYVPLADVDPAVLTPSSTTTWCPYKGEATYRGVAGAEDALWLYATPFDAVAPIAGHVAFYPSKVSIAES
jgi:uncharacterized protein (DUF427 family)